MKHTQGNYFKTIEKAKLLGLYFDWRGDNTYSISYPSGKNGLIYKDVYFETLLEANKYLDELSEV